MKNCQRSALSVNVDSEFSFESSVAQEICIQIGTIRALTVYLMLKYGEISQYLDLSIDANDYDSADSFADDYLVTEMLRKSPNLPGFTPEYRLGAAVIDFLKSEVQCRETNQRLRNHNDLPIWLYQVSRHVAAILDDLDLPYIERHMGHGPGSTTAVSGLGFVKSDKYTGEYHLTAELYPYFRSIVGARVADECKPVIVHGNKWICVPKQANKDRGICVEPDLNVYVQKGIGALIRHRLKLSGVDLDSQERNRFLASVAHKEGLVTIDLSRASDTLAYNLVLECLPSNWFRLLDMARSPKTLVAGCEAVDGFLDVFCADQMSGGYVSLEKFSSMGNGYTFELESLLFYAIACSVVPSFERNRVSVFGDDIIVPAEYADEVIRRLTFAGFSPNTKKTFLAGRFFESCGCDYFDGVNVRPFYFRGESTNKSVYFCKEPACDNPEYLNHVYILKTANALREYAYRRGYHAYCDKRFQPLWDRLVARLPRNWRQFKVPRSFSPDTGLFVSLAESSAERAGWGWEGFKIRYMRLSSVSLVKRGLSRLLCVLHDLEARFTDEEIGEKKIPGYDPKRDLPLDAASYAALQESLFTKGREPRRGYLRLPKPATTISLWESGYEWE